MTSPRVPTWLAAAVLVAATLAAYWPVLGHDFIGIDDDVMVARNPDLNPPTAAGVLKYWRSSARALYMPVTYTVWAWTAQAAYDEKPDANGINLSPAWFHALNLLLHMLTALAVFAVLSQLVENGGAALLGAMLFALHPIQVETVAWVAETKDLLAGLLSIVAIWQYALFRKSPHWTNFAFAMAAFAMAMLAKPSAVVAPAMAMLIDVMLLKQPLKRAVTAIAPALLIAVVVSIIAAKVQSGEFAGVTGAPTNISLPGRVLVAGDALSFYLFKLIAPVKFGLDYGRAPWEVLQDGWVWLTAAIPVVLSVMLWQRRDRLGELTVAAALFGLGVLPVLGLVPFDFQEKSTVADHYVYLAMLGPALALAWVVSRSPRLVVPVTIVLVALGVRTWFQTWHWRNGMTAYRHGVAVNPQSWWLRGAVAFELEKSGQLDEALAEFERCLAIAPQYAAAHAHAGSILAYRGRTAEAIKHLEASLALNPDQPEVQALLQETRKR